jgi:hypothetical protein
MGSSWLVDAESLVIIAEKLRLMDAPLKPLARQSKQHRRSRNEPPPRRLSRPCSGFEVGRAGIEPATLGLKVLAERLRRGAPDRNVLQPVQVATAASCNELQVTDASPYSHSYSHLLSS